MEEKNTNRKDIFDRIMELSVFSPVAPFYRKHKEVLLYLFFGGLTTVVSIVTFAVFYSGLGINEHVSNLISWVFAVSFAYVTNRVWVFTAHAEGARALLLEMGKFFGGRVFTLGVEELMIFVFITVLQFNAVLIKIIAQFVIVVLNYVISKLFVFKKTSIDTGS